MSNSMDQMLIPPKAKRRRSNESEIEDRISELPDCILLHILSFLNAKYAVQTCILSTRWKNLWKRLPTLILHCSDFSTLKSFTEFVSRLLTLRDGSIAPHCLDFEHSDASIVWHGLYFGHNDPIQPHLHRIVKYAVSHNVQQLGLVVTCDTEHILPCIFPSIFSCHTLTSLKLSVHPHDSFEKKLFPKSLNLPELTTLHLENFAFCTNGDGRAEPFSAFIRLNSLIIHNCGPDDPLGNLCISSMTLANLTVLDYNEDFYTIELSSPSLRTFAFTGTCYQLLSGSSLSSLEQVNIDIESYSLEDLKIDFEESNCPLRPFILLTWLVNLCNIKSLTVSANTLQFLFSIPHLLEHKIPMLGSLKSLKVKLREDKLPDGRIVDYLLQNSPSAKVDIIRCST